METPCRKVAFGALPFAAATLLALGLAHGEAVAEAGVHSDASLALRSPATVAEVARPYPLHSAALHNRVDRAIRDLNGGADVDVRDAAGRTPLMFAAAFRSMDVAGLLLARGADPNARDRRHGRSALHHAAAFGDVAIARLLLTHGASVDVRAANGEAPLHDAALHGHVEMVALLVENGADPNVSDNAAVTALQYATRQGRREAVERLRALGARPDTLVDAVNAGDAARVMILVNRGADVDAKGLSGTALHLAAAKGYLGIVGVLIDAGADLEATGDPAGARPLHLAALHNHPEVAALLIERGAQVDSRDLQGRTPLIVAATFGQAEVAATLLDHGADPHAVDDAYHNSAIHNAVRFGNVAAATLLLSRGCDVQGHLSQPRHDVAASWP